MVHRADFRVFESLVVYNQLTKFQGPNYAENFLNGFF